MTTSSGVLCDASIRRAVRDRIIGIEPFRDSHVQPASYDLTVMLDEPLCLLRREFYLLSTVECIALPTTIQGQLHGRSSIGRLGVLVHFTAGFVDPGFVGQLTLEVMALDKPFTLLPGDRIAQIAFNWLDAACANPYHGRYQRQVGVTESRFEHGDA